MDHDPKSPKPRDVLSLALSKHHSLDLVRLPESRRYRVVFAERFGVQRRAFVELTYDEALVVAKFLASISNGMLPLEPEDFDEPTDPGRPRSMPPTVIAELDRKLDGDPE
jgi:hypothetical protein